MSEQLIVDKQEVARVVGDIDGMRDMNMNTLESDTYFTIADQIVEASTDLEKGTSRDLLRAEAMSDVIDTYAAHGRDVSVLRGQFAKDIDQGLKTGHITSEQADYLRDEANNSAQEDSAKPERKQGRLKTRTKVALGLIAAATVVGLVSCNDDSEYEKVTTTTEVEVDADIDQDVDTDTDTTVIDEDTDIDVDIDNSEEGIAFNEDFDAEKFEQWINAAYDNIDTGDNAQHLIGQFEIDANNAEYSAENFYNELRHNPESLGLWQACVGTGTPSYEACVENPAALDFAESLIAAYRVMPIGERAEDAEELIAKFKAMNLDGIQSFTGTYKTVSTDGNEIFASTNYRENDPRLVFTDENGNTFKIRGCAQIVQEMESQPTSPMAQPEKPVLEQPAPQSPEQPETPDEPEESEHIPTTTTTVPGESTTTTTSTIPETTTTTSTTVPETTTTILKPKVDNNDTPAGVPGQNGGSGTEDSGPTGPGEGPATDEGIRPDGGRGDEVVPTSAPEITTTTRPATTEAPATTSPDTGADQDPETGAGEDNEDKGSTDPNKAGLGLLGAVPLGLAGVAYHLQNRRQEEELELLEDDKKKGKRA